MIPDKPTLKFTLGSSLTSRELRGLGGPGALGLGSGKPFDALSFIIQHPEWREREEKGKKFERNIFDEKRGAPGVAAVVLREEYIYVSPISWAYIPGDSQTASPAGLNLRHGLL